MKESQNGGTKLERNMLQIITLLFRLTQLPKALYDGALGCEYSITQILGTHIYCLPIDYYVFQAARF